MSKPFEMMPLISLLSSFALIKGKIYTRNFTNESYSFIIKNQGQVNISEAQVLMELPTFQGNNRRILHFRGLKPHPKINCKDAMPDYFRKRPKSKTFFARQEKKYLIYVSSTFQFVWNKSFHTFKKPILVVIND